MSKRMAIFTVSIGHGHHQVSKALQEEWEGRGFEAEIIDIFSKINTTTAKVVKKIYFYCIHHAPKLWDWTYHLTNMKGAENLSMPFFTWWGKELLQYCNEQEFDYIVATHPMATQIGRIIKRRSRRPSNLFAVLTDFSTHTFSISKEVDGIFVAEAEERRQLEEKQPDCSFHSFGIPLTKTWDSLKHKDFYRRKLGIPLREKIVVIAGGGEGVYREEELLAILGGEKLGLQVYWFLGKGQKIRESQLLANGTVIHYFPFSENYADYVKGADLFLSKPGGVSMAEAMRWQIPTGILPPLPGQEKINQQVLNSYPHVKILEHSSSLVDTMVELAPSGRNSFSTDDGACAREQIIDCILEYAGEAHEERNKERSFNRTRFGRKPSFTFSTRNT